MVKRLKLLIMQIIDTSSKLKVPSWKIKKWSPRMELKQPVQQMAEKSVELIKNKIDGKDIDTLTVLPVEFVDGGTTR